MLYVRDTLVDLEPQTCRFASNIIDNSGTSERQKNIIKTNSSNNTAQVLVKNNANKIFYGVSYKYGFPCSIGLILTLSCKCPASNTG